MQINSINAVIYCSEEKRRTAFVGLAPAPWTGWGIYAKQLCMALQGQGVAWPYTPFGAGKTAACGYEWSLLSRQINAASLDLFGSLPPKKYDPELALIMYFMVLVMTLMGPISCQLEVKRKLQLDFLK